MCHDDDVVTFASQEGSVGEKPAELFLSGVFPEEGSPPPSSTPDNLNSKGR